MKKVALLIPFLLFTACVNVPLSPNWNRSEKPAYTDYLDSYFFGLTGEQDVDPARACVDQKPMGYRKVKTFEDIFLSVITLGIYFPTTVKVWCGS